jgi:hypothetical protein
MSVRRKKEQRPKHLGHKLLRSWRSVLDLPLKLDTEIIGAFVRMVDESALYFFHGRGRPKRFTGEDGGLPDQASIDPMPERC